MRTFGLFLVVSLPLLGFSPSPQASGLARGQIGIRLAVEGKGEIMIRLATDRAPLASDRIRKLAGEGFYDGQRFFKVVRQPKPFLVQCGDPNSRSKSMDDASLGTYSSGTKVPFENSGLKHERGSVGLARLEGNKNSGDSQFYIMLDNAPFLDGQYTVFGQVVSGMDVVNRIELGDKITRVSVVGN